MAARGDGTGGLRRGLFSAGRRALTAGWSQTVTLIAFEALAISTVMPVVAGELGGLDLYGWVSRCSSWAA